MSAKKGDKIKQRAKNAVELPSVEGAPDCIICTEPVDGNNRLFCVTTCGHPEPICSLCFFKIRSLQHNHNCPTCKTSLDNVICTPSPDASYNEFTIWGDTISNAGEERYHFDESSRMFFPIAYFQEKIAKLRLYQCTICQQVRRDFKQLKGHYFGEHKLHLCQLCHDHKQAFPSELQCYDAQSYERHIRSGDNDGFNGHPSCEFCRTRFYDSHALFIHLTREHYSCHICEAQGIKFKYYHTYNHLEAHFRKDHFFCEESVCVERRFVVFANEIDLVAHRRSFHPQLSTSRTIPIRFTYRTSTNTTESNDRNSAQNTHQTATNNPDNIARTARFEGGLGGRAQDGEWQVELQMMTTDPRDPNRNNNSTEIRVVSEEFPTLNPALRTANSGVSMTWSHARDHGPLNARNAFQAEFPALPTAPSTSQKLSAQSLLIKPKTQQLSVGKKNAKKVAIPMSRSLGDLQQPQTTAAATATDNRPMSKPSATNDNNNDQWPALSQLHAHDAYEYDLAAAISASLNDFQQQQSSSSRESSAKTTASSDDHSPVVGRISNTASVRPPPAPMTAEEAFPSLQSSTTMDMMPTKKAGASNTSSGGKKSGNKPLSNDLMDALKAINVQPKPKKKTGLTVVKTIRSSSSSDAISGMVAPPRPPAAGVATRIATSSNSSNISSSGGWVKKQSYGGFGGEES